MRSFRRCLALVAGPLLMAVPANGALIHQATSVDAAIPPNDDGYNAADVTITMGINAIGPDAAGLAAGNVGLNRFWNSEFAGFSLSSVNGSTLDNETEFLTGYLQWTVSADTGYELDLNQLEIASARGGGLPAEQVRGFKLYAAVNGGPFSFADTPLIDVPNETGVRATPELRVGNLSGPAFQNAQSITFRYYPLTPATGNSMDFARVTLDGTVSAVPEPATGVVLGVGMLGLLARRRRQA